MTTWWLSLLQWNDIGMGNLVKPRQIVIGAILRTPRWHNIAKGNDMLLLLHSRLITKLIHRMMRWVRMKSSRHGQTTSAPPPNDKT